jgi:hypothetical protein
VFGIEAKRIKAGIDFPLAVVTVKELAQDTKRIPPGCAFVRES